jgi:regulator of protease activity HflC (stomatin/prohibitin superfamily)
VTFSAALEAEQKRQQELAEEQAKRQADHARAKAAIEAAHAELTAEQAVLNDRAQKLSADRMEIARLRDEVRKQKPQLAALMEVMEAELPADKG